MALDKFQSLRILLIPNYILLFFLFSRSYGKHIHSDIGRMRLEIANLHENQHGASESASLGIPQLVTGSPGHSSFPSQESSASEVRQQVVTGPPGNSSFPAPESLASEVPQQVVTGLPGHSTFPAPESSASEVPQQVVTGPPVHSHFPGPESSPEVRQQVVTGSPGPSSFPAPESSSGVPQQVVTGPPVHSHFPGPESSPEVPQQVVTGPPGNSSFPGPESSLPEVRQQVVTGPPGHSSFPAPESSASGIIQQVLSFQGTSSFPANFSLYLLPFIYPLQNISDLKISRPYIEMYWDEFSRSDSSYLPIAQEDSNSTSETRPTHAKYSLKFSKNPPSTKINSLIFPESFSVTKGSRVTPNHSQGNKVTDTPSKESFEMAKDSLHLNETDIYHIIKIQPKRTSKAAVTANSQGDVDLTITTYRNGRTMFHKSDMECTSECHMRNSNSTCVVDVKCCGDRYCDGDYLKCLEGNLITTI